MNPSDKEIIQQVIEYNIQNGRVDKVESALLLAREAEVPVEIQFRGYNYCGDHYFAKNDYVSAFYHFNKARVIDLLDDNIIGKTLSTLFNFFEQFQEHFSKDDLEIYLQPVEQLTDYYKIKGSVKQEYIDSLFALQNKINYWKKYKAPEQVETKASFKVHQIYDAFSNDMTFDEMINEFSRMAALMIFEDVEEKENSEDKKKEGDDKKPSPIKENDDEGVDE